MGYRLWAFFLVAWPFFGSCAFADSTVTASADTSERVEELADGGKPVISNAHSRANEVISLSLDYLDSISKRLDDASLKRHPEKDPVQVEREKRHILGPFCLQSLPGGPEEEPMEVCEQRFSWYRASALSRARLAIATNNESVENLKDSRKAGGLAREELVTKGGAAAPAPRPKPPTVLPFVPRYTSLQADRAARENDPQSRAELERYLGSTEFEDEVRRSLMPKPAKDDFVKMVKVGENSWVPQRDAQGKLDIDWEKFNAAEKEYKRSMEALQIPQVDELKEIQQKRSTLRRELQKFAQPEALAPKNAGREAALKDNYDRAHDGAVESINAAWANKNKSGPAARESATQVGAAKVEKPGEKKIVPGAADGKEVGFRTSAYSVEALEKMRNQIIEKQKIPKKPGS